jgi:hypothetical protein
VSRRFRPSAEDTIARSIADRQDSNAVRFWASVRD